MSASIHNEEESRRFEPQDEVGNSLANIRRNLKLTPVERLRQADAMLEFALRMKGKANARK